MKPYLTYLNRGGTELDKPSKRDIELLSRRDFVRRATLFLPLAFFAGAAVRSAKATSVIVSRTISAANQNAIQMANATWARPITLPASWNKVRVGIRAHMVNTGANLTANPIFTWGLNSGTTLQYGDATCQNFVGCAYDFATWTYSATGTSSYSLAAGGHQPKARTRVGTTNTDADLYADGALPIINSGAGTNSADRQIMFLDITKGSPNFTLHFPFRSTTVFGLPGDVSATNFLFYMAQLAPVVAEANYDDVANCASPTLAVNEGLNGTLNSLNLYWNRANALFEICDIAVAVLA